MVAQIWRVAVLGLLLLVALSFALSGEGVDAVVAATASCLWFVSRLRIVDEVGAGTLFLRRRAAVEGLQMLCLAIFMLTAVGFAVAMIFLPWTQTNEGRLLDLALVGLVVLLKRELERHDDAFHRRWRGIRAEDAVAEALSQLRERGWAVVDGVPRDDLRGNVDHALRGPNRSFAVETKSYGQISNANVAQAIGNAVWLKERWGVRWVDAVVCIDKPGHIPTERASGKGTAWVVDRRDLCEWLIEADAMPRRTRRGSSSPRRRSPAPAAP